MPTPSKRFLIVALDSSIAMMPLPGATMAWAIAASWSILMGAGPGCGGKPAIIPGRRGRASELAEPLGATVRTDLQQPQGVRGAVDFHVVAAGDHHGVALVQQAEVRQLLH